MKISSRILSVAMLASSCVAVQESKDDLAGNPGFSFLRRLPSEKRWYYSPPPPAPAPRPTPYPPRPTHKPPTHRPPTHKPPTHKPPTHKPPTYKPPTYKETDGGGEKKGLPGTKCPSAITIAQPHPGILGDDKCFRGAACQTRYTANPLLIGNDILSVAGSQASYLQSIGLIEFMPYPAYDSFFLAVFNNTCGVTTLPGKRMLTQEDDGEVVKTSDVEKRAKEAEKAEVEKMRDEPMDREAMPRGSFGGTSGVPQWKMGPPEGFACFVDICLQQGAEAFLFLFDLNLVPFQNEFVRLCTCILTGGVQCTKTCGCYQGFSDPELPMQLPFCDCYCACCHE